MLSAPSALALTRTLARRRSTFGDATSPCRREWTLGAIVRVVAAIVVAARRCATRVVLLVDFIAIDATVVIVACLVVVVNVIARGSSRAGSLYDVDVPQSGSLDNAQHRCGAVSRVYRARTTTNARRMMEG
jgi:hypothetical protein